MRAFFNIDIEHPFEQPGPADAGWRFVVGWVAVNLCGMSCVDREVGDGGTVLGSGREHVMEATKMKNSKSFHPNSGDSFMPTCLKDARPFPCYLTRTPYNPVSAVI